MKKLLLLLLSFNVFAGPVNLSGVESYQVVFFDPDGFTGLGASVYDLKNRKLVKSKSKFPELLFYLSPEIKGTPYLSFSDYNIYENGKLICSQGLLCENPMFEVGAFLGENIFMHFKFNKDESSHKYFVNYKSKKLFFEFSSLKGYQRVFSDSDLASNEGSSSKVYRVYEPQSKVIADFSKKYPNYAKKLAHYKKCAKASDLSCFFSTYEDEKEAFLLYISPLRESEQLRLTNEKLTLHYENLKKDKKHYEIILDALEKGSLRNYDFIGSQIESIEICGKKTWSIEGNTLRTCYVAKVYLNEKKRDHNVEIHLVVEDVNSSYGY